MADYEPSSTSTVVGGLPISPSLGPTLDSARVPVEAKLVDGRVIFISALAVAVALASGLVAQILTRLIGLITNLSFYGRVSTAFSSPADNHLGLLVIAVPVLGGVIVGLMARFGSKAIRGHGIPEAMEQVLTNQSRIPARVTFLKPISAAISIGTGGPFGAEGPIIATGGALGSVVGQLLKTTALERKTLLAAGAAAGMAATFGSPVSAVLLVVELLLFEFRPRSLVPVSLAAATAAGVRISFVGSAPIFGMPDVKAPGLAALGIYVLLGVLVGVVSIFVTRIVYAIEDGFEKLPIHWMWWPALGAVAVGIVGVFAPRTMGVGYDNIDAILGGVFSLRVVAFLCVMKFVSWSISLGSGTSGGTLAPLFTIGGGLGAVLGAATAALLPAVGIDPRIAALVGMAAIFAGASRAVLTSVVFAFETTRQPLGLLPLLGGCMGAFLVSCLFMRNTIMSEKIVRRGVRVIGEYVADFLDQVSVRDRATRAVTTLRADQTVGEARAWFESGAKGTEHQGFPIVDASGALVGLLTRRDVLDDGADDDARLGSLVKRPIIAVFEDSSLREAADLMAVEKVGRLAVVDRHDTRALVGIVTRSDILAAHAARIEEASRTEQHLNMPIPRYLRRERHV